MIRRLSAMGICVAIVLSAVGCETHEPDRELRMQRGFVYYLDGAGGGSALSNYAGGIKKGMKDAGYEGTGKIFVWQTGLGVTADQLASESFKRKKAGQLAKEIAAYKKEYPGATVNLMALSAGTAVAVFTLEAMPADQSVRNVILLSGSLSSVYDLTKALGRVEGKLYVFTSTKDAVLRYGIAMYGTADRAKGTRRTIGLNGVDPPRRVSAGTRRLYAKVVEIAWNEEFRDYGHQGGHTDSVKAAFVQAVVAPLVVISPRPFQVASALEVGEVANPAYGRWANFAPGSWVTFEGTEVLDGDRRPLRAKVTLAKAMGDLLLVDRVIEAGGGASAFAENHSAYITKTVDPQNNPMSHPSTKIVERGEEMVTIGGKRIRCKVREVTATGEFSEWGRNPWFRLLMSPEIPGGIAKLELKTERDGLPVEIQMEAVEFQGKRK